MKRILVVDDEERIRTLYGKLLQDEGYKIFTASNAIDANEILKRESIDLVLLDIKLPEIDGGIFYETIQLFHRNTRVIITSVYGLVEQKQIVNNATDYHDKSESSDILLFKVKEALREDQRKNILIIDDDPKWRSLFSRRIKEWGFHAAEAPNACKALAMIKPCNTDVILLDIVLPDSCGLEVYDEIRARFPFIKIIIASVHPVEEQQFLIADADEYFYKSDDLSILADKIKSVLSTTVVNHMH